jgi:hypothetical protein
MKYYWKLQQGHLNAFNSTQNWISQFTRRTWIQNCHKLCWPAKSTNFFIHSPGLHQHTRVVLHILSTKRGYVMIGFFFFGVETDKSVSVWAFVPIAYSHAVTVSPVMEMRYTWAQKCGSKHAASPSYQTYIWEGKKINFISSFLYIPPLSLLSITREVWLRASAGGVVGRLKQWIVRANEIRPRLPPS